ncbi:sce7726 family protein [uncultured Desulfosarcina sp.]|uniref:sce7726 family protein n=1 Tax=uncultured Desulfosarcina sp. TaxID=218289 RepID=UPI0029C61994|nr:sce7726 family protein [uncultured Desulfosarcina sp.]
MTKDIDIRKSVLTELNQKYLNDSETMIIEELGLCQGDARIDVAVVNGSIHGLEIKSDQDTLKRLPGQIEIYNKTLDRVTLVVGSKHFDQAVKIIPRWWGVTLATNISNKIKLRVNRKANSNPGLDPSAVVQLIWRDEALSALKDRDLHRGFSNKPRSEIWNKLVTSLQTEELLELVREILKSRENWRSALQPT